MARKPTVVLGLLGTQLDSGLTEARWERWRPTVDLCRHEDFVVDRLELLTQRRFATLTRRVQADIALVAPETRVSLHEVEMADPWDFQEVYGALHDFARAYPFRPEREDYLVHVTTGTHVAQICLFLLTEARFLPARLIQTGPPTGHGKGEPGRIDIIDLDLSRYDRIARRFERARNDDLASLKSGIATRNEAFNRTIERIEKVAVASTAPILLTGPTGAGKSLLAKRIYEVRRARHLVAGAFVDLNCATLRGDAAMSALFGHVKGAFTGALSDRPGLLRAADRGILFLDEIGELGLDEQAMLLRALEDKTFLPMGSDREARSDFQLLAGTNRDLGLAVREGRFRDDLLARIDLWTFRLPGLAERREDLAPNLDYELESWSRARGERITFSKEARERYLAFAASPAATWPGNFRDLNASVVRMATLAPGGRIDLATVEEEIARLVSSSRGPAGLPDPAGASYSLIEDVLGPPRAAELDRFDRVQLAEVLRVCRSARSLSEAGRTLFEVSRTRKSSVNDADRLRKYLARFALDWSQVSAASGVR